MRYHWIRDRCDLKDFYIEWRSGKDSVADLLTKAHPTPHFLSMRKHYVDFSPPTFPTTDSRRRERRANFFGTTEPVSVTSAPVSVTSVPVSVTSAPVSVTGGKKFKKSSAAAGPAAPMLTTQPHQVAG